MSEPKFTPGPWETLPPLKIRATSNGFVVATASQPNSFFRGKERDEEIMTCKANANLIAAAPDLYEALLMERRMRLLGQEPDAHWESLRDERRVSAEKTDAALAKARGET